MSCFVDTGVFYAAFDERASRHDVARRALSTVLRDPGYGRVLTSDYVYDETVTLTQRRTGSQERAAAVGERLRSDDGGAVALLHATTEQFEAAVAVFEQYGDHDLSFTDAMTVAVVDAHDVDAVLSFDDDFDGLVERVDPAAVAGE